MAGRHRHARQQPAQAGRSLGLVRRIDVGVQERHRDRFHPRCADGGGGGVDILQRQRRAHRAARVHALGGFQAQMPGHERFFGQRMQIVQIGPVAPPDGDHVAEAARGDQRGAHALALGDRVDDGGAAMHEQAHRAVEQPGFRRLRQRGQHAFGRIVRRGQCLAEEDAPGGVVEPHQIGEGAAGIGCHADHARSPSVATKSTAPVSSTATP